MARLLLSTVLLSGAGLGDASAAAMDASSAQSVVGKLNNFRCAHQARNLSWSAGLAEEALAWLGGEGVKQDSYKRKYDALAGSTKDNPFFFAPGSSAAESVASTYFGGVTADGTATAYETAVSENPMRWGYTQIVWAKTSVVGCATAELSKATVVACFFDVGPTASPADYKEHVKAFRPDRLESCGATPSTRTGAAQVDSADVQGMDPTSPFGGEGDVRFGDDDTFVPEETEGGAAAAAGNGSAAAGSMSDGATLRAAAAPLALAMTAVAVARA